MCCNCMVTRCFGCARACVRSSRSLAALCDNDSRHSRLPLHTLIKVLLVNPRADVSRPSRRLIGGKCICFFFCAAAIWLGRHAASAAVMARCWKVLQEQIWRRHPVNKEPAETSCEQHGAEMCDFMRGPAGDRQSVIHCCYPLPYWPWSIAGKLPMRKCKEFETQMFIFLVVFLFSWCLLWSISYLLFWINHLSVSPQMKHVTMMGFGLPWGQY